MSNKEVTYTEMDKTIYNTLKSADRPLALSEISEAAGVEIKAGHIVAAIRKGIAVKADEPVIANKRAKKSACTYLKGTSTIEDLRAANPKMNFTEKEIALAALLTDEARTASQINEDAGLDATSSFKPGTFTSLVKKGVAVKGEPVTFEVEVPTKVNAYVIGATVVAE